MATKFKPVTHVIFDLDGLLLDTEEHYSKAANLYLKRFNHEFTWDVKQKMMGRKPQDAVGILVNHYQLPVTVDEYIAENKIVMEELFPTANLMPGAEKLVKHLVLHEIPICICTGSTKRNYDLKATRHGEFFSLFHHIVFSPDDPEVVHGKPEPDCFLVGAKRFDKPIPKPEQVLVFEDAVNGVEAARKAQMQVVLVPDGRMEEKFKEAATLCLNSLVDFKPELFGLPPF